VSFGDRIFERVTGVRREEYGAGLAALVTLAGVMVAHELLEVARDALFLQKLPPTQLPWVYLAIAVIGMGLSLGRMNERTLKGALSATLVASSAVTFGFYFLVRTEATWSYYALYVWTGLLATITVAQFWLLLGRLFTTTEAKRVFGFVGLGGIAGALVGALVASGLARVLPMNALVIAAAATLLLASFGPRFIRGTRAETPQPKKSQGLEVKRCFKEVGKHPYTRRVVILALLSTLTFTFVDYVFKSVVAREIPPEELGAFFATLSIVLNAGSLLSQLTLVRLLDRVGLPYALALLPLLLLGGGVGIAVGGGLVAAIGMKLADGSLRHSLHRTSTELLFVPMSDMLRAATKLFTDVAIHRGGQALASLAILAVVSLAEPSATSFAIATSVLAGCWVLALFPMKGSYLDLFRATLAEQFTETRLRFPELRLRSLETVIEALNSENDGEVLAALEVLGEEGKTKLIPALIVHHPSREVVLRAVEVLREAGSPRLPKIVRALVESDDPELRAAALRTWARSPDDPESFRDFRADDAPDVRAAALVGLLAAGEEVARHEASLLAMSDGSDQDRLAVARAVEARPAPRFAPLLVKLGETHHVETMRVVASAMAKHPDERFVPVLIGMLSHRSPRVRAREALVAIGEPALDALNATFDDPNVPPEVLLHVPRTMSRFEAKRSAPLLLAYLLREDGTGAVRFKALRALGRLKADEPRLKLDDAAVWRLVERTVGSAFEVLHWRLVMRAAVREHESYSTPTQELLSSLLDQREAMRIERVFRLLGILHPKERFEHAYRGLRSRDSTLRSSGRELVGGILDGELREAVLGLIDDSRDRERLAEAGPFFTPRRDATYADVLSTIVATEDVTLQCAAAYHAGEIGLEELREQIDELARSPMDLVAEAAKRALFLLQHPYEEQVRYA